MDTNTIKSKSKEYSDEELTAIMNEAEPFSDEEIRNIEYDSCELLDRKRVRATIAKLQLKLNKKKVN